MTGRLYFLSLALLFALVSCARVGAPTGGPKDTTPPRLDTAASTPNYQIQFSPRRIELVFDEYVELKDPAAQILISPPLNRRPEIIQRLKTVSLELRENEVLRPNTTYTINFGAAVVDFRAGNPAQDLRFVFSTGSQIDSLKAAGRVADAFTGEPVKNVRIMVYENSSDSVVQRERPYYIANTNDAGEFNIGNMRPGEYRIIAVEDADQNLRWSGRGEKLAFIDSLVRVDSLNQPETLLLRLYSESGNGELASQQSDRYGLVQLLFNGPPPPGRLAIGDSSGLRATSSEVRLIPELSGDTVRIYYYQTGSTPWRLLVGPDTVPVRSFPRSEFFRTYRLRFADQISSGALSGARKASAVTTVPPLPPPKTVAQNIGQPAILTFPYPIEKYDTAQWLVQMDTITTRDFTVGPDSIRPTALRFTLPWRRETTYTLTLLPGAVSDFFGVSNTDTLKRIFTVPGEKQLGDLLLVIKNLEPGEAYLLEVLKDKNIVINRAFTASAEEMRMEFRKIATGAYQLRLIEDRNRNGRWDPGNYYRNFLPETVYQRTTETVRANWELEVEFNRRAGSQQRKN